MDCDDAERSGERYLVGEEEAIWLLRLVLPYINEVLLNLRSLFSGEPATTKKVKKGPLSASVNATEFGKITGVVDACIWTHL